MTTEAVGTKEAPILKIRGLCKDFSPSGLRRGRIRAIDHVDLEIARGEARGIVGESGSGKTTLARCITRLIEPSSGRIEFDGRDLSSLSPPELRSLRKEFQMIFQDAAGSLNPAMTVRQILLEPLEIHRIGDGSSRELRVRELLDSVSLSESLLPRMPAELSGGQQQRVGIARGLALKPRLLIADEPVSALDASVQAQILNLLGDLKRRFGFTLILISHSLHAIRYLCSDISVLYKGRIVEEAPAAGFFLAPGHPYSRSLLAATPGMDSRWKNAIPAKDAATEDCGSGCAFRTDCPDRLPRCSERIPPLAATESGGKVACHAYPPKPDPDDV